MGIAKIENGTNAIENKSIIILQNNKTTSGLIKKISLNEDKARLSFSSAIEYQSAPTDFLDMGKCLPELEKGEKEIKPENYEIEFQYLNLNSGNIRLYIEV